MARLADPRVRKIIGQNICRQIGTREVGIVASALGMSQAQLSGYAHGHRGFSIETLLRFAVGFACSLDDLVRGVDVQYMKAALKRRHRAMISELEADQDMLDVMTGFDLMRGENPSEAASVAGMFKARLRAAGLQPTVGASDATVPDASAASGSPGRPALKRRRAVRP